MAILLALVSALSYGLSDFVGGLVSRRTSAWPVAVLGQVSSAACTLLFALTRGGDPTGTDLAWAALAGVGSGVGTGFLYRGLASGRMGVVSPISAVGAAVVPVLAGTAGGERPALLVWVGVVAALPGIWLVSSSPADDLAHVDEPPGPPAAPRTSLSAGVVDGVLSGLGFGLLFASLGQVPDRAGMMPLALAQAVSVPAVVLLALALRASWVPRGRPVRWALLAGPLGAAATGAFLLATQHGYLTVAGVLASLYPASTVLLAALVLRERVHRAQGVGLGLCALSVVLVAAG
ncbi:MAG: EamA family transporter [Nocardioidaceae bacterium]